jgi:hypothetical protein
VFDGELKPKPLLAFLHERAPPAKAEPGDLDAMRRERFAVRVADLTAADLDATIDGAEPAWIVGFYNEAEGAFACRVFFCVCCVCSTRSKETLAFIYINAKINHPLPKTHNQQKQRARAPSRSTPRARC